MRQVTCQRSFELLNDISHALSLGHLYDNVDMKTVVCHSSRPLNLEAALTVRPED